MVKLLHQTVTRSSSLQRQFPLFPLNVEEPHGVIQKSSGSGQGKGLCSLCAP